MTHDARTIAARCAALPGVSVDHSFGDDVDVHRVGNKMFALVNTGGGEIVTLKAAPEDVVALGAEHDAVGPGYYMNKKHWITVDLSQEFDATELEELVAESYRLVLEGLPRRLQREIRPDA